MAPYLRLLVIFCIVRVFVIIKFCLYYREMDCLKPSYFHCVGSEPLSSLTIGQLVDIAAEKWKDREALVSVYQGHRLTFNEVRNKVRQIHN